MPAFRPALPVVLTLLTCGFAVKLPTNLRADDAPSAADAGGIRFFENKIRPLLVARCTSCHGAKKQESGFRADTFAGLVQGGDSGVALVPGKPDESLLIAAVGYQDESLQMPPDKPLSGAEIADLKRWVALGMPHPDAAGITPRRSQWDLDEARQFWSLQPPSAPALPTTVAPVASPIDLFVRAQQADMQLAPNPSADRATLIRRLTFDLVGLPPAPHRVRQFLADPAPDALDRVADRLLASPRYGERWGRHWLDVARYADSNGLDENIAHGNAWRYRDYVIAAMNEDKPYDQFLVEQIAGDLLPAANDAQRNAQLIATGFLSLGPKVIAEGDEVKMEMDIIDEQLSTLGRSLLGMTIGCARCHDHKFDPLLTEDYYALAGIFKSTRTMESLKRIARWWENPTPDAVTRQTQAAHQAKVDAQQAKIDQLLSVADQQLTPAQAKLDPAARAKLYSPDIQKQLAPLQKTLKEIQDAAPAVPSAMGVTEGEVTDLQVHLRGSHLSLGKRVPRRIPVVFVGSEQPAFPTAQSGRLELASWLTADDQPLVSRVMVNRVWRWHFGQGIVSTPDNFGRLGSAPTHGPLLDWLAVRFRQDGWSLKRLHRLVISSETYRQSSDDNAANSSIDPANQQLWRSHVRRLEAEAFRDSLLLVGHQLDSHMGGSLLHVGNREFLFNHLSKDTTTYDSRKRSVYLPVIRNHLYDVFQLFDYADASVLNGNRPTTTVPSQALFLMNADLVESVCASMAEEVLRDPQTTTSARIERLYWQTLGRGAEPREIDRAVQFIEQLTTLDGLRPAGEAQATAWKAFCHALLASNEFIYVQ